VKRKRQRHLAALALALDRSVKLAEEANLAFLAKTDVVTGRELLRRTDEGAPARAIESLC